MAFWQAALGYRLKYPASDDWAILAPRAGRGIQLSLNLVSSSHARLLILDSYPLLSKQAEVARLLALGATRMDWAYPPDADYVVLQDPDGNPFCVVQK